MSVVQSRAKKFCLAQPDGVVAVAEESGLLSSDHPCGNSIAKSRRIVRGKRGSLRDLPAMPLDILFEVFAHMDPIDLLSLARTSRDFRALLMSKAASPFWKAARKNVENLPECPLFMSEPAFANLLFCSHCHNCLKPNIKVVMWEFMARYCADCKHLKTMSQRSVRIPGLQAWDPMVVSTLPTITERGKRRYYETKVLVRDVENLTNLLSSVAGDKSQIEAIIDTQKEHAKTIRSFANVCATWYETKKECRSQELDRIKRARLMAVVERLRSLGWGEELEHMAKTNYQGLSRISAVKQAKPLTDRTWVNLRKTVENYMSDAKAARLLAVKKGVLRDRLKVLRQVVHKWRQSFDGLFPHARDFAAFPEVRAIVDVPVDAIVTTESFDVLEPSLPDLVSSWRSAANQQLLDVLTSHSSTKCGEGIDPLSLATAMLFNCQRCCATRTYPEVLTHCCQYYMFYEDEATEVYNTCANASMGAKPWNPSAFRAVEQNVKVLLSICEKDPSQTTQEDMDILDARFVCNSCDGNGIETVMTWRTAIVHALERHGSSYGPPSRIEKATDEHAAKARSVEVAAAEKIAERAAEKSSGGWHCAACANPRFDSKALVNSHMQSEHGKTDGYVDADYYRHPDSSPQFPDPIYLCSSKLDQTYLPFKLTVARQTGLVAFQDDIPLGRNSFFDFHFDPLDLLMDDVGSSPYFGDMYEDFYGMSDDDDDYGDDYDLGLFPLY